ncbi:MAG: TetR/AcrR family transcriptional regulator [Gaiella sp.]
MAERSDLRERVVAGAFTAVAEHGWAGATLERIAAASGVSRMTLHRHGLGREEVFVLLAAAYEDDFRAAVANAADVPGRGADRLRSALAAVCHVTERHLAFLRALDEETDTRLFHVRDAEVRSRRGYVDPVAAVVCDGIADGSLRAMAEKETATLLVNAVDRTYRHLRSAHGWSPRRTREAVLDVVLRGVQAEDP